MLQSGTQITGERTTGLRPVCTVCVGVSVCINAQDEYIKAFSHIYEI